VNIPFAFAKRHNVLAAAGDGGVTTVLYTSETPACVLQELQRVAPGELAFTHYTGTDFDRRLQSAYEQDASRSEEMMADLTGALDLTALANELNEPTDLLESADDAPIIRLINALLGEAIVEGASDIHIEPFEQRLAIRLRVDGVMREIMQPPAAIAPLVVSRIKIMAKLDIAEKRLPQDGRISLRVANRPVDVRVSTIPCGHGERVVLRLLDKQAGRLDLEQIGMNPATTARLDAVIHRPHGIFLVTGPTGSGKTTTLYAALSRLNDRSRNLMTVEDPIEYLIDGIAQTQVNLKVDMTFARGLRAILRQDPDVVMVGEIRDLETAQIAIQASLTGHLVLSTLHTNSAIGAVTRLRDMGTEPFLLSSSLIGVLAQRLVRTPCKTCRRAVPLDPATREWLGVAPAAEGMLYQAVGCPECNRTGYRGRAAIYELIVIDEILRRLIHDGAAEQDLEAHARLSSPGLGEVGRRAVLAGVTTPEELLRVTQLG
jgi:general secretion pathway protein E